MSFKWINNFIRVNVKVHKKNKFLKHGLPFLVLVLGGSFGLREFAQIRYQFSNTKRISKDEEEKLNEKRKGPVTLETEYDKIKDLDIEHWENKRGPRPWETTTVT